MDESVSREFVALQTALAGRYSLDRELGRGGMGVVYLAHEVALDRPVALKLLPAEMCAAVDVRSRFLQEARTAAKLSHPNIVPIFAVDEVDGFVFFAMPLVQGETLGERVRSRGPLSDSEAVRVLREVAWALAHAHAQGVVHRDVKPDNILLEEGTGRALVMDFGIAQVETTGADADAEPASRTVGTAEFMSPEQARGAPVDARSDLYALGAVGFYAVSGRAPFEDPSAAAVLAKHITERSPPVATVAPQVSTPLARVIDRCLRKEPERRFPDAASVAEALSADTPAERVLPVPLRVFVRRLRDSRQTPLTTVLVAPLVAGFLMMGAGFGPGGLLGGAGAAAVGFAGVSGWLAHLARKVLKAGHTVEDARLALRQDVMRRNEEFRFEFGERKTRADSLLKTTGIAGLTLGWMGLLAPAAGLPASLAELAVLPLFVAAGALVLSAVRARRRADVIGEAWLKFWDGRPGKWLFKLGGIGLGAPEALGAGAYRPTEMAIGISVAKLFESLPKETRSELAELPRTVSKLETDAGVLRRHLAEVDAVLSELGDHPASSDDEAHAEVHVEVRATRDEIQRRLRAVVTALEAIRLGLLRMHAGEHVAHRVTMDLETASSLSTDLANLLEGHREVERILSERRATGAFTIA